MMQAATVRARQETRTFPRAAIAYAIKELARRAGVASTAFRDWRIEFGEDGFVNVFVLPGTKKRLCFPRASGYFWEKTEAGTWHTSTATWNRIPKSLASLVPDFKVPFSSGATEDIGPLFALVRSDRVDCALDLPSSVVLTLSRFEETLPVYRDGYGRFPASSSVAWRDGFLHRPIVDEYGLGLAEALSQLLPGWKPIKRCLHVKLSHDVDDIGIPFRLRSAVGHTVRRHSLLATVRDLLALATGIDTTYLLLLRKLVTLSVERGLDSAVYWKASAPGLHDSGYDPQHPRVSALIELFRSKGVEMGIHPGFETFDSPRRLHEEVSALQEALGQVQLGGRQDFLRWKPETWLQWDCLGLVYDASVGFADHIGFRAGTSYPFHPWLLSQCREANLLEIPLLAMDSTLQSYMKLPAADALATLRDCVARCRAVGGVFSLGWHNTKLLEPAYTLAYRSLLDELAGSERYDWRTASDGQY